MHRNFKRPVLAAILLAVIASTFSCTRPEDSIGLGIQPGEDILAVNQTDTVTIVAGTVKEDSLRTDELSHSLLGNYLDPALGLTRASLYTQLRLSSNNVDFGLSDDILIDSLVLAFKFEGNHQGNTVPQMFEVYEIEENFFLDSTYYSTRTLPTKSQNLVLAGHEIIMPDVNESVTVGTDSVGPQLRIHLDTTFAREAFVMKSGTDSLADNINFVNYFHGLYIKSTSPDGSVLSLDLYDGASNMTMYYRDLSGEEPDTTSFVFNINNLCPHFYHVEHSRIFDLAGLNEVDTLFADPYVYAQGGGNVQAVVRFPHIKKLADVEDLVINRADLIIPIEEDPFERYPKPGTLLLRRNLDEGTALLPDETTFNYEIDGVYDEELSAYRFNISRFIQRSITGVIDDPEVLVIVEDRYALTSGIVGPSVRRVIMNGPSTDMDDPSKNMRLILTFSY